MLGDRSVTTVTELRYVISCMYVCMYNINYYVIVHYAVLYFALYEEFARLARD